MNALKTGLLVALSLLMVAAVAQARPGGRRGRGPMKPEAIERIADKLGLEASVVARLKEKLYAAQARHIELRAELDQAKLRMRRALDQAEPDRAAVMRAIEEVGRLRTEQRKLKTGALLDVRAELTPAQREQLKGMRKQFRERRKGERGERGRRGKRGKRGGGWAPASDLP